MTGPKTFTGPEPKHFETDLTRAVAAVWAALTTGQHSASKTAAREQFPVLLECLIGRGITEVEIAAIVRATPTLRPRPLRFAVGVDPARPGAERTVTIPWPADPVGIHVRNAEPTHDPVFREPKSPNNTCECFAGSSVCGRRPAGAFMKPGWPDSLALCERCEADAHTHECPAPQGERTEDFYQRTDRMTREHYDGPDPAPPVPQGERTELPADRFHTHTGGIPRCGLCKDTGMRPSARRGERVRCNCAAGVVRDPRCGSPDDRAIFHVTGCKCSDI